MAVQTRDPTLLNTIYGTVEGFWGGWLGGSAILAGGKLWTLLFDPKKKVSDLLGHIGKPIFRRQLAVGIAVYTLISCVFAALGEQLKVNPNRLHGQLYIILTQSVSIAVASLAAAVTTDVGHLYIFYVVCAISIAIIAKGIFDYAKRT